MAEASYSEPDRLVVINDALRRQSGDVSPWLPLESNPELFTEFAHCVGLQSSWRWVDVLGLDDDLLEMVPLPCVAVILLFPCTPRIYAARALEERETRAAAKTGHCPPPCVFLKQHAEFGNACGTIASVHALSNTRHLTQGAGSGGSGGLDDFCNSTRGQDADQRGRALLACPALKSASDGAASMPAAQTALPDRHGPDLDHHFCTLRRVLPEAAQGSEHGGRLVELDGTKWAPVDHGPCAEPGDLLRDAAAVVREKFMALEPDSIEFTLMALCRTQSP